MPITNEMWITLLILIIAMFFFITERLRVDAVALGVVVALMVTNILSVDEALAGFSNSAVLLIAALFIVGGAVFQTGLANMLANQIVSFAGTSETRLLATLMIAVAVMSGFVSDTGTVAVLMPAVISVALAMKINPSKLLMPLAFASLLGGASTLIGTPPNIIVSEVLAESGFESFQFFSFTPIGIALIITGVMFTLLIRAYLPDNKPQNDEEQSSTTTMELIETYALPDSIFRVRIRSNSPLVGQSIADAGIGRLYNLHILEILRLPPERKLAAIGNQEITVQAKRQIPIHPQPTTQLEHNDLLIVQGTADDVSQMVLDKGLSIQPRSIQDRDAIMSEEVGVAEVILPPRSSLLGKTLIELRFSTLYKLQVLEIRRAGQEHIAPFKSEPLVFGDTLLVQGAWADISELSKRPRDFVLIGGTKEIETHLLNRTKAPVALLILVGMLILLITGILPTTATAMLASLLVVVTGCLTMDDAYKAIDWKSIVLIAGMLPMSTALVKVGWVDLLANGLVDTLGNLGPIYVIAGLFLLTSVLTQVLSNTTTTVIIAPIAIVVAQQMNVAPQAFVMAVAIAASMAFASPVASPVNTLVMGAGNYRFSDYAKLGIPFILLAFVVTMLILPFLFPF